MNLKATGRPRQTTHDDISRVALEMFSARGYSSTSLAEIASAAGISRTTLFSYFPAKRELLWEDHEVALARVRAVLRDASDGPVVDLLVEGMLAASTYGVHEHDLFAVRWRIVREDDELRAYAGVRSEELWRILLDAALERAPAAQPDLVDSVARALMSVASRSTEVWSTQDHARESLDEFTAMRLAPIAAALRPLLP